MLPSEKYIFVADTHLYLEPERRTHMLKILNSYYRK